MDSKLRNLLDVALAKTQRGVLQWQSSDPQSFRTRFGRGYLHVQRSTVPYLGRDADTALRYSVQITDHVGQVVAEADTVEGEQDFVPLLRDLFTAARTAGLGGYEIIDSMLEELKVLP